MVPLWLLITCTILLLVIICPKLLTLNISWKGVFEGIKELVISIITATCVAVIMLSICQMIISQIKVLKMDTYTVYDFYSFAQNIAIGASVISGIFLLFSTLTLLNYRPSKSEIIFCIVNALIIGICLFCGLYMNYLQIR